MNEVSLLINIVPESVSILAAPLDYYFQYDSIE